MIGHTFLNEKERKTLDETLKNIMFGESAQDNFLKKLMKQFPLEEDAFNFSPKLLYCDETYLKEGNWRILRNQDNTDLAYAYFDYPIMKSPLYIGTNLPMFMYPLIKGVQKAGKYNPIRTTPVNNSIFTMKIYTGFKNESRIESIRSLESKQTLEYFHEEFPSPNAEYLMEVIDSEDLPKNFLKELSEMV